MEAALVGAVITILKVGAEAFVAACPAGIGALTEMAHCKIPALFVQLGAAARP
jgi:hypothetical protein